MLTLHKLVLSVALPTMGYLMYLLWKRYSEEEEEPPLPRNPVVSTEVQSQIEIEVPCSVVGMLIGRQGANIKKLEKDSGARLHVKREAEMTHHDGVSSATRKLIVHGTTEAAQLAEVLVRRELAKIKGTVTEEIGVPQHAIGLILGPRGETINQITYATGTRIKIGDKSGLADSIVSVTVSGEKAQVQQAKEHLAVLVQEAIATRESQIPGFGSITGIAAPLRCVRDIPKLQWPDHQNYTTVYVSSRDHPAHYWVHMLELYDNRSENVRALDDLRKAMTEYYSGIHETDSIPKSGLGDALQQWNHGDVVAARFPIDGSWYRAAIHEVLLDGRFDVTYFDYGDSDVVSSCDIHPLRSDYWSLPQQAVECYAANIEPVGEAWTEEACIFFDEMAHVGEWQALMARRVTFARNSAGEQVPCIVLIDTNCAEDINIGNKLIEHGFAKKSPANEEEPCQS